MCYFVILLLSNEMQMSVRRFSAIPHLRAVPLLSSFHTSNYSENSHWLIFGAVWHQMFFILQ